MSERAKVGLEVHAYVGAASKLFCPCPADFLSAEANTRVCPVCTGQPGAKPFAPNGRAVEAAVAAARALGCRVEPGARFLRKHYFYPDLPSNYQRTSQPVGVDGELAGVGILEVHLEEDPGAYDLAGGTVDYNRSGVPLLEIVTAPDLRSPEDARNFLQELRLVLAYLGAWNEAAGVKADVNVSVAGGPRAEVKNVNSIRNVEQAVRFEIERQTRAVEAGETLRQETRGFDEATGRTVHLRTKETAADYRYLPDPDLRVVDVAAVAARLTSEELPLDRRARLAAALELDAAEVSPLLTDRPLLDAMEATAERVPLRSAFHFFLRDVRGELEARGVDFRESDLDADELADLLAAMDAGKVTAHVAKRLLRHALDEGALAEALEQELEAGVADEGLGAVAREVLEENPKAVDDYRGGKTAVVNFLVGQVMRKTRGRATPEAARDAVQEALEKGA